VPGVTVGIADEPDDGDVAAAGEVAADGEDPVGEVAELDVADALGAADAVAPVDPKAEGTSPAWLRPAGPSWAGHGPPVLVAAL
jgi:hypothetical protein